MAVNRHLPHLLVLPEDDATRSLAVGFSDQASGPLQVLHPARGWPHVLTCFDQDQVPHLRQYGDAHIVLLIDFDDDFPGRLKHFRIRIPDDVADRVYVLGALTEAETLKRYTGKKFGPLGEALARECQAGSMALWDCPQLRHNKPEVARLVAAAKPFLW